MAIRGSGTPTSTTPRKGLSTASAKPAVSRLAEKIPAGTWDSHMHVVDPINYPVSAKALYMPSPHTLEQAAAFESRLGIRNMVIVQPSIYGTDNTCTLDALRALGPRHGRAVVSIDPKNTSPETLEQWHALGVRGVRLNLKSVGRTVSREELFRELKEYAEVIRPLDWVLQVYLSLDMVQGMEDFVPDLGVKLCIDHLGHPTLPQSAADAGPLDPYALPGFASLVKLLQGGRTWVKCSAAYRIEEDPQMPWVEAIARELLRAAGSRVVFATDWPHTRFDGLDVEPFVEACLAWCESDVDLVSALFRKNAEELWDAASSGSHAR